MELPNKSLSALLEFLEFTKSNGYSNPATAIKRINIVKEIFEKVPNVDTKDVTVIDTDSVLERFAIITANKINPSTLSADKSHFKGSIRDFSEYLQDPAGYKPKRRGAKPKAPNKDNKPKISRESPPAPAPRPDSSPDLRLTNSHSNSKISLVLQINISSETDIQKIEQIIESISKRFG